MLWCCRWKSEIIFVCCMCRRYVGRRLKIKNLLLPIFNLHLILIWWWEGLHDTWTVRIGTRKLNLSKWFIKYVTNLIESGNMRNDVRNEVSVWLRLRHHRHGRILSTASSPMTNVEFSKKKQSETTQMFLAVGCISERPRDLNKNFTKIYSNSK
jgi:hypothetical protein